MHRWKLSALAAAAFVSAALTTTDASALVLGNLAVRSSIGENLNAEISLPQATAAELNSLAAQIASAATFQAQGLDYSNTARAIQVQVQRNADGTASLHLSSNTPIQDPFVDLVLETQWNTGRMVRSYTLLLDPPTAQRKAATPTVAPQVTPAPASVTGRSYQSGNSPAPRTAAPTATPAQPVPPAPTQRTARAVPAPAAVVAAPKPTPAPAANATSTTVRAGDTAGRIANTNRPAGVSLDQMLVAMLRSNPDAFINGNVNRIRAGAVVQMPSQEQALETSRNEARRIVAAQSRDFNTYRRSLASKAPQATVQAADRSSSGQVQAHVAETRPTAETPDKLTLSKGSVQNNQPESKLAEQKQASDQDSRMNELQRNLAELNELAQNTAPTAAPAASTTAANADTAATLPPVPKATDTATPAVDVPAPVAATEASTSSTTEGAAPPDATTATAPAAEPVPTAPTAAAANEAASPSATLQDDLLANPLVPAGAGLIVLLLGVLGYTAWKRRRAAQTEQDPSLGDSQLHPDSFFGGSGGQQVDTSGDNTGASTMAYSPSQLDGGGDVDPVAEADVYLAYGRDVQAEEILKEALRSQPDRLSIPVKLAEIYVKRHDIKGLEEVARSMQAVSNSHTPEWQRVVEMGRNMDPTNPFFAAADTAPATGNTNKPTSAFAAALGAIHAASAEAPSAPQIPEIDLNLDLPEDGFTPSAANATIPSAASSTAPRPSDDDYAALDLDLAQPSVQQDLPTLVQDTQMPADIDTDAAHGFDFDLSDLDLPGNKPADAPQTPTETASSRPEPKLDLSADTPATPAPVAKPAEGMEFDLGSLDLDLGAPEAPAAPAQPVHNLADDPLSTKLDLAQEFNSIGDSEGARALIEEVLTEASGPLKDRAQKMLSELD